MKCFATVIIASLLLMSHNIYCSNNTLSEYVANIEGVVSTYTLAAIPQVQTLILGDKEVTLKGTAFELRQNKKTIWRQVIPETSSVILGDTPYIGAVASLRSGRLFVILATPYTGWVGVSEVISFEPLSEDCEERPVIVAAPEQLKPAQVKADHVIQSPSAEVMARLPQIHVISVVDSQDQTQLLIEVNTTSKTLLSFNIVSREFQLISQEEP